MQLSSGLFLYLTGISDAVALVICGKTVSHGWGAETHVVWDEEGTAAVSVTGSVFQPGAGLSMRAHSNSSTHSHHGDNNL